MLLCKFLKIIVSQHPIQKVVMHFYQFAVKKDLIT